MSSDFQKFLQTKGITSQRTCLYTPHQNGVAERKNIHLLDVTRSLLLEPSVPTRFWVEELATAAHLINCMPSPSIANQSPYYRLYKASPSYAKLHVFGSICIVHLPPSEKTKLAAQSRKGSFAMILTFVAFVPLGMLCFLKTSIFFTKTLILRTRTPY